ncbi:MAG TPA: hypothetical protein DEA05_10510 [Rhodobacteraceae bacterium]|nr:hypothetical protein [Paracoccaceae bacterium]
MTPYRQVAAALAAALTLAIAVPAGAKPLSRMLSDTGLTPADIATMTAAADALPAPGPVTGARRDWTNAESGSRGNVQVIGVQGACVTLRHQFRAGTVTRTGQVETQRCRDAQGAWVAQ